ncbi:hypothetical protein LIER_15292 [Lithospermum erythrorhizon]|uniref:Pentatricopeptide repeat-containing protein n=1 Tax=Lithospermum erythrorhizon TaxID=34254 RepID=A0AAV3Q2D5_LITER
MHISHISPPFSPQQLLTILQKSTKNTHKKPIKQIHSHLTTNGYLLITSKWTNTLLYNALIHAYTTLSHPQTTLILFTHMVFHQAPPNKLTFPSLIKSSTSSLNQAKPNQTKPYTSKWGNWGRVCEYEVFRQSCVESTSWLIFGKTLHAQAIRRGLYDDPFVKTSLMSMYSCGCEIWSAREMFDELSQPCVVSCNAMLDGYVKNRDMGSAVSLFWDMNVRDVYSWTSVINGYAKSERFFEAIELFAKMMRDDDVSKGLVRPNEATFVSVLSSCASFDGVGGLFQGKQVHGFMIRNEYELSVYMGTALISFYGKRGCLEYAIRLFETMVIKEVCAWNALISILALNGREMQALEMFAKMKAGGWNPNEVTFVAVLSACARAKLVDLGLELFQSMSNGFNVEPMMEHYGCVVDMLGRAGLLKEAYQFVTSMPFKADATVLGALLGACRVDGDVELGNEVGKLLLEVQPYHCGSYVQLSSIYAGAEKWDNAATLREQMVDAGIEKIPAYSIIQT